MGRRLVLLPSATAVAVAVLASTALASGPALTGGARQPLSGGGSVSAVSMARASLLWATVNVCDTPRHPNALGIRASMPGNGLRERMYMRFRAEYYRAATDAWTAAKGAVSPWVYVGSAQYRYRQGGWTFGFAQPQTGQTYTMRGIVDFQWRARKRRRHRHHRHHRRHHRHHRRHHWRHHRRHHRRARTARWVVAHHRTRPTRTGMRPITGGDPAGTSKAFCLIY